MRIRHCIVLVTAVMTLFFCNGCASLGERVQTPAISLSHVRLTDLKLTRQTFLLGLDVENPNPFPLPISSIDYALNLAGQAFAQGQTDSGFTVPANGQESFQVSVETNLAETARALSQIILAGGQRELDYELHGDLKVNLPFTKALPFRRAGIVRLDR